MSRVDCSAATPYVSVDVMLSEYSGCSSVAEEEKGGNKRQLSRDGH